MPISVHLIRIHHQHWGKYSCLNQFVKYVNPEIVQFDEQIITMGNDRFPIPRKRVRRYLQRLIQQNGCNVYLLNDLVAESIALYRWGRRQIDVVHYLEGEHSLQYLPQLFDKLRPFKLRLPIVATFHQPPDILESFSNIEIIRLIDRVIVMSPELVSYFEQFLPSHRISLIYYGIDIDYFRPKNKAKKDKSFKCLSVGSWLRDYEPIITVAEKLQPYSQIEFHIISKTVTPPTHLTNVYVHQDVDDSTLLEMYQQSDVLLLSVTNAIANTALLEGIACGLPVISTDIASIRAYVSKKEAVFIPENNPDRFVEAILNLYHKPDIRQEMSRMARDRALQLSWPNIAPDYEQMYSQL